MQRCRLLEMIVTLWNITVVSCSTCAQSAPNLDDAPSAEWIEPETGHRVVRLSREPGSRSLYFHQHGFSADGRRLVLTTRRGISAVDLETRDVETVVEGRAHALVTGRKTGDIYFLREGEVFAASLNAPHTERKVATLPSQFRGGNVTVNADESLLVGLGVDREAPSEPRPRPEGRRRDRLAGRWAAGLPMVLYTIDVASGETRVIHRSREWLNHLQCSPTDPQQIMFCHEGPWHLVNRIWLVRSDGSDLTLAHSRTMRMEIAGHEFFSGDGRAVWYDLQTPRSLVFWLARYDIGTQARTWYHLERGEWSVHYNISPDGRLLAGDGGGPASVANQSPRRERLDPPANGQWIYLFRPEEFDPITSSAAGNHIRIGKLRPERLVGLSNHDYELEPNVIFTPDGKWIVFRSNMHGETHTYMVEVARSAGEN
jgi:oligogalacturonide lyase